MAGQSARTNAAALRIFSSAGLAPHSRRARVASEVGPLPYPPPPLNEPSSACIFRSAATPQIVWGRKGYQPGDVCRPRAIAIDPQDRLYIVDYTARIQVYDADGKYLGPTWTTPDFRNGRPSGLGIDRDGHLIVADSHYGCFRIYDADGKQLKVIGETTASQPRQFDYIGDVVQDADGYWYV